MRLRNAWIFFGAALAVSPGAVRAQSGFPDVPANHWAADSVRKLEDAGILKGYPRGTPQRADDRGYDGNRLVTRYELAVTLWRFVQYIERADRQPRTDAPALGADAVKRLIAGGYLPQNTPLAVEGNKSVTANQLADALAQVVAKVTERQTPGASPGASGSSPARPPVPPANR